MKKYFILLTIALFFLMPKRILAADYYVATNGHNSYCNGLSLNPYPGGTTTNQPCAFAAIQKAANTIQGQTKKNRITVNQGTYEENVNVQSSGVASNEMLEIIANGKVIVRSFYIYPQSNYVKLSGFTVTAKDCNINQASILIRGNNNIIENNTVLNSTRTGIDLSYDSSNNTIRNNKISKVYNDGMVIGGKNNIIENNEIEFVQDHMSPCTTLEDVNGFDISGSGHIFRKNYVHNFIKANQNGTPHMDAFQVFAQTSTWGGSGSNLTIEQNHVFMGNSQTGLLEDNSPTWQGSNWSVSGFMLEGGTTGANNITIKNNIIESHTGINIGGSGNVNNLKLYNNIWRSDARFLIKDPESGAGINLWHGVNGFEIYNNMTIDYGYHINLCIANPCDVSGGMYDNNLMWNSNGSTPALSGYTLQSHDKRGVDPKFVAKFTDLHLQSISPVIDA
ncbi:DUF1565 domain-containing protein, partial [Candidatus Microgenomates bacterium]|nr:DUF1565 domain-containing protein [Candidatus Microgenomates bacterium]